MSRVMLFLVMSVAYRVHRVEKFRRLEGIKKENLEEHDVGAVTEMTGHLFVLSFPLFCSPTYVRASP